MTGITRTIIPLGQLKMPPAPLKVTVGTRKILLATSLGPYIKKNYAVLSFLSARLQTNGFLTPFKITTKAMLDPTYVAACFRCPRSPARLSRGLSRGRRPAWAGPGPPGPGSPPALSRCSGPRCHTEAEVRVAVRQGAEQKRNARGFFSHWYLHA